MTATQQFKLRVLGGLTIERVALAPTPVLVPRSSLSVLALIAATDGLSRDKLLAYRWPDSNDDRGRNSLDQALFLLRRALGSAFLVQGVTELRVNPDMVDSDLREFEEARKGRDYERAVGLYGGPFLDGFHLRGAREFERWVDGERTRIAGEYADVLERLASAAEVRSEWQAAAEWWKRLGQLDPLNSRIARLVARALVNAGDRTTALRYARAHDALVRQEAGAVPDPTLSQLVEGLRESARPDEARGEHSRHADLVAAVPPTTRVADSEPNERATLPVARTARHTKAAVIGTLSITALAIAGTVSAIALRSARSGLDAHRVVVLEASPSPRTAPNDVLGAELQERLAEGIAETALATIVSRPSTASNAVYAEASHFTSEQARAIGRAAGARYVVAAMYAVDGDSLLVSAQVADVETRAMVEPIEPVHGSRSVPRPPIDLLRTRVMAALATRLDPTMKNWSYAASMPATFESYRELRLGIDAFVVDQQSEAMSHFRASAALDTTSAAPLVWLAFVAAYHQYWRDAESAVAALEGSSRRMGAWDRALLDDIKAWIGGDLTGAHVYAHRLVEVVPNSEWAFVLGWDAWNLGRAHEAIRVLRSFDPQRGWTRGLVWYWWTLTQAYHLLGDYQGELAAAKDAVRYDPDNNSLLGLTGRALVGLGRLKESGQLCVDRTRLRAPRRLGTGDCRGQIYELRAHGYTREARALAKQMAVAATAVPDSEKARATVNAARYHYYAGDFVEAERVLRGVSAVDRNDALTVELMALLAAARGDRAAVDRALPVLDTLPQPGEWGPRESIQWPFRRAKLAALLGDRDDAVTWLTLALRAGYRWRLSLHWEPPFDRLRGYAPFDALVRPVDDHEVVRQR